MASPEILFCMLNNPYSLSLSSEQRWSIPVIIFEDLLWTHSIRFTSFLCRGLQSCTGYCRWNLIRTTTSLVFLSLLIMIWRCSSDCYHWHHIIILHSEEVPRYPSFFPHLSNHAPVMCSAPPSLYDINHIIPCHHACGYYCLLSRVWTMVYRYIRLWRPF